MSEFGTDHIDVKFYIVGVIYTRAELSISSCFLETKFHPFSPNLFNNFIKLLGF